MFGTVEYFTDFFKACIMNNFSGEKARTLPAYYEQQLDEITIGMEMSEEKEIYLTNLEKAYKKVDEELFGDRRKI